MSRRIALGAAALASAALVGIGLSGCIPSTPAPAPQPAPAPAPAPPAPPPVTAAPPPVFENFLDAPQTPGDWAYSSDARGSIARFGTAPGAPVVLLSCDLASRNVRITRAGSGSTSTAGPVEMRIRTETAERVLHAGPDAANGGLTAELAAHDPLLDAMAFTKGRFALETPGQEALYVPAYPEISRVIEDCRAGTL